MRTCTQCGIAADGSVQWTKERRCKDGLGSVCLACRRAYGRAYARAHREIQNEWRRQWKETHREEFRQQQRAYKQRNRERTNAQARARYNPADAHAYYEANKAKYAARCRRWRENNPDKSREYNRRWYAKNPDKSAAATADWVSRNRERARTIKSRAETKRRLRKYVVGYIKGHHTHEEWLAKLKASDFRCVKCGADENLTRDHIVPLARGGWDTIDNIQVLCRSCNSRKRHRIERSG